jgi:hypothetical protein
MTHRNFGLPPARLDDADLVETWGVPLFVMASIVLGFFAWVVAHHVV